MNESLSFITNHVYVHCWVFPCLLIESIIWSSIVALLRAISRCDIAWDVEGLWWSPSFVTTFCNQRFASTKAPAPAHCIDSTSWQHMWQYNNLLLLAKAAGKRTLGICCALVGFALKMRCEHSLWVTFRHNAHFCRHEASAALTSEPQRQHGSTSNVALEQPKLRYRQKTRSNLNTLS